MSSDKKADNIRQMIQKHYSHALTKMSGGGCCSSENIPQNDYSGISGYTPQQLQSLPQGIDTPSFGCGNPVDFINVKNGDTVLDLGSGSGLDLFLAAAKVGQKGRVIGVDMTQDMIDRANQNIRQAGAANIEVRLGIMENLPIADHSIDWVISNCVINLSPDKDKVFKEIFRVLKPGGQMLVSDIVTRGELPSKLKNDALAWAGCLAGALDEKDYLQKITVAGLTGVEIVGRIDYDRNQLKGFVTGCCSDGSCSISEETIELMEGKIASVKVFAQKPAGSVKVI